MFAVMNKNTYKYAIADIPRDMAFTLAVRVCQGMFNMFCTYYVIKYFPLVYVSIVANIAPLLIALFAFLIYREKLTALDVGVLLVSFAGVSVLITGSVSSDKPVDPTVQTATLIIPIFLLILIPFN